MAAQWLARLASGDFWNVFKHYVGAGRRSRPDPIGDRDALKRFLVTRSNFIAQSTLYGYLRTRAGTRFSELWENDAFTDATNQAKWNIWLACLSDLAVFAGGLLAQHSGASPVEAGRVAQGLVDEILAETGTPAESGPDYQRLTGEVRARLASTDWAGVPDDAGAFTESPAALVRWAPVIEEFMQTDSEIVANSVRFAWQEIRRVLRRDLDAAAVMRSAQGTTQASQA